jgi:hypothetical protein
MSSKRGESGANPDHTSASNLYHTSYSVRYSVPIIDLCTEALPTSTEYVLLHLHFTMLDHKDFSLYVS